MNSDFEDDFEDLQSVYNPDLGFAKRWINAQSHNFDKISILNENDIKDVQKLYKQIHSLHNDLANAESTRLTWVEECTRVIIKLHEKEVLLAKYIKWVEGCEGVNFITSGTFYHPEDVFTKVEWDELKRLANEKGI